MQPTQLNDKMMFVIVHLLQTKYLLKQVQHLGATNARKKMKCNCNCNLTSTMGNQCCQRPQKNNTKNNYKWHVWGKWNTYICFIVMSFNWEESRMEFLSKYAS